MVAVPEGRSREECIEIKKEREQELRLLMKRLEAKYAALQVVPVISKLGTQRVHAQYDSYSYRTTTRVIWQKAESLPTQLFFCVCQVAA